MSAVEFVVVVSGTVVPRNILLDTGDAFEQVRTPDSWTGIPSKQEAVDVFKTFLNIDRLPAGSMYTLTLSEMFHVRGRQWRLHLESQDRKCQGRGARGKGMKSKGKGHKPYGQ